MLKTLRRLKRSLGAAWRTWAAEGGQDRALSARAELLQQLTADCRDLEDLVDVALSVEWFRPLQKRTEILGLLRLVQELRPRRLLEIGSANGGTLFLLTRVAGPDARLLSLDLAPTRARRAVFPTFARPDQQLTCLQGDSHEPATLRQVEDWLGGGQLDFLFIDGDHSYEGVARDYSMYGPLVRAGGIVAFHDIVPDFRTRHGLASSSYAGGVPRFWGELRAQGVESGEFIQHPKQDGYGIGYVRVGSG
ncbi:MAG: class I SAM-dependent methyltransferase [Gemmataceae bacterium]|nr:class I SAM-dependent methyltransferase [Gemmataceae bacterium]